jgi:uncharacterized protein (TIGR02270 family)
MSKLFFQNSIYSDHLEAASFLYGQRLALFSNPEVSWLTIRKFEERFEAHLDALITGGEAALEVCCRQAKEGDAGELHAALRVFCRLERKDLFIDSLGGLDPEDTEKQRAFVEALNYELPVAWQENFAALLDSDDSQLCDMIAAVVGYRRLPADQLLLQAVRRKASIPILWALGRLRERNAASLLSQHLNHDDDTVCAAAAVALLRIGDAAVVPHCLKIAAETTWTHIPLALGGDRSAVPILRQAAGVDDANADTILALGILGDISVVALLMAQLGGDLAPAAAQALDLVTGAHLYERVFIPDEVEEDDLLDEEKEAFKQGKMPTKPDGTPYGVYVNRLSQDQQVWSAWWSENYSKFDEKIRYRNGRAYSPASLLETLQAEKSSFRVRQLAYEELVIRYDMDVSFEADLLVIDQLRIMNEINLWITAHRARFKDGEWYFAEKV